MLLLPESLLEIVDHLVDEPDRKAKRLIDILDGINEPTDWFVTSVQLFLDKLSIDAIIKYPPLLDLLSCPGYKQLDLFSYK